MCSETYIGNRIAEVERDLTPWIPSVPYRLERTEVGPYGVHAGLLLDSAGGGTR